MYQQYRSVWVSYSAIVTMLTSSLLSQSALAVGGLNYIEASHLGPVVNLSPFTAFEADTTPTNDGFWGMRQDFGAGVMVDAVNTPITNVLDAVGVYQSSNDTENTPELTFTFSGSQVLPAGSWDVYAVFWSDDDENWTISAGTAQGVLTQYSFAGTGGPFPITGVTTTKGVTAGAAIWDTNPLPNPRGTFFHDLRFQDPMNPPNNDPLVLLLAKAGTVVSDGVNDVSVYIDDLPGQGGSRRSWFDGVAYVEAGTTIALTTTINRATGELVITNPTARSFSIASVGIESLGGALIGANWNPITGNLDNGGGFDTDDWNIVAPADPSMTPFAQQLLESEDVSGGGTGGTLAANGGTLNLGNVWRRNPFEDVIVELTLTDGTRARISPEFVGTPIAPAIPGDFDYSGVVDLADYQTLLDNLHTSLVGKGAIERFARGDLIPDSVMNFLDYQAFRNAWNLAHGAGAFEAMVAGTQVPEPSSVALLLLMGGIMVGYARRRLGKGVCVLLVSLAGISETQAQTLLSVDVNLRTNLPANQQAGFLSFILSPATPVALTTPTTQAVGAYTVTLAPYDDLMDENSVTEGIQSNPGAYEDRLRTVPVNSGAFTYANLYKDFVFANGTTGPTGGMDLTISGGSLVANKGYVVSIYAWDQSSAGPREAHWYDATNTLSPILTAPFTGAAANSPTTNHQYRFSGIAQANESGVLMLQGRNASGYVAAGTVTNAVFLNGFEIEEFNGLTLEVATNTGKMRFLNESGSAIDMSYYEIRSTSGQLIKNNWTSFDSTEGGDPVGDGWDEVTNSNEFIFSEGNLTSLTSIAASGMSGDSFNLGNAFIVDGTRDLRFFYANPNDSNLQAGFVKYIVAADELTGDYNDDGVVNAADYVVWRDNLNSSTDLPGDLIGGTIGTGQYNQWRQNFGATPGSGSGAAAIPEPASAALLLLAAIGWLAKSCHFVKI